MAKASTRFRNRKINFKTRLGVRTGPAANEYVDDGAAETVEFEEDKSKGDHVETGVDKEEEHEVHLQAILTSTGGSSSATGHNKAGSGAIQKSSAKAFIPTPDSTGTIAVELYRSLYPSNVFHDPATHIRFSDTVEDSIRGAADYTMDEDDEDWLEAYNAAIQQKSASAGATGPDGDAKENTALLVNGRSPRDKKQKGRDSNAAATPGVIAEDDFEEIMEFLEKVAEEKAPMAHVNPESLPSLNDCEGSFATSLAKPSIQRLRPLLKVIYPHWRERRLQRGGKTIIPQLDYDESNENNPYVCFRRREVKTSRKTRRSDAQNIERLVRLRNDLFAAHALLLKVREREAFKLEAIVSERNIFEGRVQLRELKRRLGETDGDEDLLIGRREKRRKKDDPQATALRLSLRKPDATMLSPAALSASAADLNALKERAAAIQARIERDMTKKRELDKDWEDWTDGAYMTRVPPPPARYWRMVEPVPGSAPFNSPYGKRESLGFSSVYQPASGPIRANFRRRIGRGGRIMLDRIATGPGSPRRRKDSTGTVSSPPSDSDDSDVDYEAEATANARRAERFRFDNDADLEFPTLSDPAVVDDFSTRYLLRRSALLKPVDFESLSVDSSYLEDAYRWAAQEPERPPPPVVFGRPAPRPAIANQPQGAAAGPGGIPIQLQAGANAGSPNAAAAAAFAAGQSARVPVQWRVAS